MGLYDPCDKGLQWSKGIGTATRNAELILAIPNIGAWTKNPVLYEIGSSTVPTDVYELMDGLTAIQKGNYLISNFGLGGTLALNLEAVGTGAFAQTIGTGLTPGDWLLVVGASNYLK